MNLITALQCRFQFKVILCIQLLTCCSHFASYLSSLYLSFYISRTGIGKYIALDFARRGARVILACRSEARGTEALKEIRQISGNQNVHLRLVDTSSLESVRKFAAQVLKEEKELHILVNNAGASGIQ